MTKMWEALDRMPRKGHGSIHPRYLGHGNNHLLNGAAARRARTPIRAAFLWRRDLERIALDRDHRHAEATSLQWRVIRWREARVRHRS